MQLQRTMPFRLRTQRGTPSRVDAQSEHALQRAVVQWAGLMTRQHPQLRWLFAVPNAAKRTPWERTQLLQEGMRAGVWDMCLPYPMHGYGALWIEHKHGRNDLTDDQRAFGAAMRAAGNACIVSYDFETTRTAIVDYLSGTFKDQGGW